MSPVLLLVRNLLQGVLVLQRLREEYTLHPLKSNTFENAVGDDFPAANQHKRSFRRDT
jgi:hypothetical protein